MNNLGEEETDAAIRYAGEVKYLIIPGERVRFTKDDIKRELCELDKNSCYGERHKV